jgi:hypothetical protein
LYLPPTTELAAGGNSGHQVRRSFSSHREEMRSLERTISYVSNI